MLSSELLNGSLRELLHVFCEFVNLRPRHVVSLAVVPNELHVSEYILVSNILPSLQQCLFDSLEVHGSFHDLGIIKEAHLYQIYFKTKYGILTLPSDGLQEWISVRVLLNRLK